jgi:hypothetical protein
LNAGCPVIGERPRSHKRSFASPVPRSSWGTTLDYVRLYDKTVSSDYHLAMVLVQRQLEAPEDGASPPYDLEKLLILAQAFRADGQDAAQAELIYQF